MIPLKQKEQINLIWADYHFNKDGECSKIVTKINTIADADSTVLGREIYESINKLADGYKKEFGDIYDDIIYVYQIESQSYFEVFHPYARELKRLKFDFQGNLIND